jgi:membrane associated rhomboid family serine protease
VRCARCDRPFCPECLREASVGFHCAECLTGADGRATADVRRTVAGAVQVDRALMVPGLIAVNTAIYLWTAAQARSAVNNELAPLFQSWALNIPAIAGGQWWRLFTSGFLHFGPIHLLFNMLALWVIGKDFELVLGRVRFLAVYLIGLLGGSAAAFLFGSPSTQVAGASGAVFGLMGGLVVLLRRMDLSLRPVVTLIVINLVISFVVPNISILGHLGGLVMGAVATAALVHAPTRHRNQWQAVLTVTIVFLLLLAMALRSV